MCMRRRTHNLKNLADTWDTFLKLREILNKISRKFKKKICEIFRKLKKKLEKNFNKF